MSPDERAQSLAEKFLNWGVILNEPYWDEITRAIRQAENDALERAAAYVEGEDCTGHETAMALYIRNLKHAEP